MIKKWLKIEKKEWILRRFIVISVDQGTICNRLVDLVDKFIIILSFNEVSMGPPFDEPHMLLSVADVSQNFLWVFNRDYVVVDACNQGDRDSVDGV